MKYKHIGAWIIVFLVTLIFIFLYMNQGRIKPRTEAPVNQKTEIRYVPIGDSYTIGYGISEQERWPNMLTDHLRKDEIQITLVKNPAITGYTVRDTIEFELPVVDRIKPNFVTVLIGANDSFEYKNYKLFQKDFIELLDKLQLIILNPKRIVLITLPDYTKAPAVKGYDTNELLHSIGKYNDVIKEEGYKRGLLAVDIFPVSQTMTSDEDYVLDGLHPSAKGYAKWEKVIFPIVKNHLGSIME